MMKKFLLSAIAVLAMTICSFAQMQVCSWFNTCSPHENEADYSTGIIPVYPVDIVFTVGVPVDECISLKIPSEISGSDIIPMMSSMTISVNSLTINELVNLPNGLTACTSANPMEANGTYTLHITGTPTIANEYPLNIRGEIDGESNSAFVSMSLLNNYFNGTNGLSTGIIITVVEAVPLAADFTTTPEATGLLTQAVNINEGETVTYTNTSTSADHIAWSFEGGNPATSSNNEVTVTYSTAGTYTATLTAYNATETISDSKAITVVVSEIVCETTSCEPVTNQTMSETTIPYYCPQSLTFELGQDVDACITIKCPETTNITLLGMQSTADIESLTISSFGNLPEGLSYCVSHVDMDLTTNNYATIHITGTAPSTNGEYELELSGVLTGTATAMGMNLPLSNQDVSIATGIVLTIGEEVTPIADFTTTPEATMDIASFDLTQAVRIVQGETVTYTNTSTNAHHIAWSFPGGDPTTSTTNNVTVTYNTVGTFTTELIAYNEDEAISDSKSVTIKVSEPPTANFSTNPATTGIFSSSVYINAGGTITYTNLSTAYDHIAWSFEGGSPATSTENEVTVTYSTAGTYTTTLTAYNADESISDSKTITVYVMAADFTTDREATSFGGILTYISINQGETVTFTNASTNAHHIAWSFEGGFPQSSTNNTVTVYFFNAGNYTATLTAYNEDETVSDSKTIYIMVSETLAANFSTNPAATGIFSSSVYINAGGTITYTNQSAATDHIAWSFEGGSPATSTENEVTVTYSTAGTYTTTLTAYNADESISDSKTITVYVMAADFTTNPEATNLFITSYVSINQGETITFTDASINAHHIAWTFEGGAPSTSTENVVTVTYAEAGSFTATLTAYNEDETISSSKSVSISVADIYAVEASFYTDPEYTDLYIYRTLSVETETTVTYTSTCNENTDHIAWTFEGGNTTTSTENTVSVTYYTAGDYTTTLVAYNADETRTDTITLSVNVTGNPFYTITVASENDSYGTANGGGIYESGTQTTISATANEHYHFVHWNDGNTQNPRTITVNDNATYTAFFAIDQFTITATSANASMGYVNGGGIYDYGTEILISAIANSGYRFTSWNDGTTQNPRSITVTGNATYIANFEVNAYYTSFTAEACGSYTWNDHTYTESGAYQQTFTASNFADSIVTLTLTIHTLPQPEISASGTLDGCNPSPITLSTGNYSSYLWSTDENTASINVVAPGYYYVEVIDENGCTGVSEQINVGISNAITEAPQISVVGLNNMNRNVVTWSAIADDNISAYHIYRENNVADLYELMGIVTASAQTYWTDETADPSARAYRYKITAVDECGSESPMSEYHKTMHLTINQGIGNTWNLIWSHYEGFDFGTYRIYRGTRPSDMVMIGEVPSNLNSYTDNTATANEGFYYQVEVVRNTRARDAEIASRSNIVDNGYLPEHTIAVLSANTNYGTVSGGGTYPEGLAITISATANEGYRFTTWNDGNTDNPRTVTVTEDATYIASFEALPNQYTITVLSANNAMGTVNGGGTFEEGTIIQISADAHDGYEFSWWDDGNTDNPRNITVTENATYIASFAPATDIEENIAPEISIFPNPTSNLLNIISSETISEIEIVNVIGQIVLQMDVNSDNAVCNVSNLSNGMYFIRIYGNENGNIYTKKLTKE